MKNKIKFSLTLFGAGDVINTTLSAATGNDLSAEMKTFYDKALIELATPNLVHDQFGQKRKIPKNGGKSIEFRCFSALPKATTAITEGVTPTGNKLNVKSIVCTPEQYGDYIELSDVFELTSVDNTVIEATKKLADQAGRTLDTIVRNELNGGTNVQYCVGEAMGSPKYCMDRHELDNTCLMTVKEIYKAAAALKRMNAPKIDGYYVAIIHPYVAYDLMEDAGDRFLPVGQYATPNGLFIGEIGCIGGVRFVETSEAMTYTAAEGAGNYKVYSTLILGADAYGVTEMEGGIENIIKQKGYGNDPLNQRSSVGWKAHKAAKRLVEEYMIRVEGCCSLY
jgi:N4-gp56 family major capsid protein